LTRSVAEPDAATTCILVLAETLAGQLDAGVAGQYPPYVWSKLASTYANTLQLAAQLVGPVGHDTFEEFVRQMAVPRFGGSDERWD
jgi:hypothetical protein